MGYNATVVVLVDRLGEIERDPHFGKKLVEAIRYQMNSGQRKRGEPGWEMFGNEATGQTQVIGVHHADHIEVFAVGGNTGRRLGVGGGYAASDADIIQRLREQQPRKP